MTDAPLLLSCLKLVARARRHGPDALAIASLAVAPLAVGATVVLSLLS